MNSDPFDESLFLKGLEKRKATLGAEYVEKNLAAADDFTRPFQEAMTAWAWGFGWGDEVIDVKTRSMMNLAMIGALGRLHEWETHCRGALTNGVSREEIRAIIHVVGIYCGVPMALECFRVARRVLEEAEQNAAAGSDLNAKQNPALSGTRDEAWPSAPVVVCPVVVCYDVDAVPKRDANWLAQWRESLVTVETVEIAPRDAATFTVPAGYGFRIHCQQGPQVGDLNLWNRDDLSERFFSGKTRQLHASHLTRGDRLWSSLPSLRAMATITHDSLEDYGWDDDGAGVHDVIGTRCDPYTNQLLRHTDYHNCCHSNLTRALAAHLGCPASEAETHIHDVLNVFMCTGFTQDTHQYFMKASPVRPGDYLEFLADIDLLGALSACPGGDCSSSHSDDETPCYPLAVEVLRPAQALLDEFVPSAANAYSGTHGEGQDRERS